MSTGKEKVGIIGSGLIGKSWAMIFASQGYQVSMYDIDNSQVQKALKGILEEMKVLEQDGVLRGTLSAEEQHLLIHGTDDLESCVESSIHVQECIPESLELKKALWTKVDGLISENTVVLASSTSCILPSNISEQLVHREQFIVAHPVNPPYYVPMVELVPSPWTSQSTKSKCKAMMSGLGQVPVMMTKELPGFVLNRLQYALLNECWNLVSGGIVTAEDLDIVMKEGLGLRYAVCGPMEVIHLNAEGLKKYCETYGSTIHNVSKDFKGPPETWKMDSREAIKEVDEVHEQLVQMYPMDQLDHRRLRRDKALAAMAKLKRDLQL